MLIDGRKKSVLVVSNLGRGILVLILPFCLLINKQEMGFFLYLGHFGYFY